MKIGQFFILGFTEKFVPHHIKKWILEEDLLGIILFSRNFENKTQLKNLINNLLDLKTQVSKEPLLIGIDSEGGFVNRFRGIIPSLPSAFSQGLYNQINITKQLYYSNSIELKKLGINCNFAPVCDVVSKNMKSAIGIRSFHYDYLKTSKFVKSAISGIKEGGLLTCAKHFPGLGKAILDTHFELPVCKLNIKKIMNDLIPFKTAINSNINIIMTSHCIFSSIDNDIATFSRNINHTLLREQLKYKGLLISDDLCMGALSKNFELSEAVYKTLSSGVDSVMICHETHKLENIKDKLKESIKSFSNSYISERKERIKTLWLNYNTISKNFKKHDLKNDISDIKIKIAKKTFIWNKKQKLSFNKDDEIILLIPPLYPTFGIEEKNKEDSFLIKNLKKIFSNIKIKYLKESIESFDNNDFNEINFFKKNCKTFLLIGNYSNAKQVEFFIKKIYAITKSLDIVIFLKNPLYSKSIYKYCKNIFFSCGFNMENQLAIIDFIKKHFIFKI